MKLISEEVTNAEYVVEDNNGKKEYKIKDHIEETIKDVINVKTQYLRV